MTTQSAFKNLHIVDHPLVRHKLSRMRDEGCPTGEFRRLLKEISLLLGYEATRSLGIKSIKIKKSKQRVKMIKPLNSSYYDLLRDKLLWAANAIEHEVKTIPGHHA